MVTEDYGKRAYVKLNALEKRIEKLENFAMESIYSEIFYNLAGAESNDAFEKKFKVNALKDGLYSFTANLETDLASLITVRCEVLVNGVKAYEFKNLLTSKHSFSFELGLNKGENEIMVKVNSSLIFSLTTLNFKVFGTVSYVKTINALSHISSDEKDFILHLNNSDCLVYSYQSEILQKHGSYSGVKECSIIDFKDNTLFILAVDETQTLKVLTFNFASKNFTVYDLNVGAVNSACGFKKNNNYIIYFSKLSKVYKGVYALNGDFNYEDTNIKGVKLYTDPLSNGNMVVVDKYLNAKLFTD